MNVTRDKPSSCAVCLVLQLLVIMSHCRTRLIQQKTANIIYLGLKKYSVLESICNQY